MNSLFLVCVILFASKDHLAIVGRLARLELAHLQEQRKVRVLIVAVVALFLAHVSRPNLVVVVVDDHAFEIGFCIVDKLVECVLAIWRKYKAKAACSETEKKNRDEFIGIQKMKAYFKENFLSYTHLVLRACISCDKALLLIHRKKGFIKQKKMLN